MIRTSHDCGSEPVSTEFPYVNPASLLSRIRMNVMARSAATGPCSMRDIQFVVQVPTAGLTEYLVSLRVDVTHLSEPLL